MPRFFFDTDDGKFKITDVLGVELHSSAEVESTARDFLLDLSHVDIVSNMERVFKTQVRNNEGAMIYQASMMIKMTAV